AVVWAVLESAVLCVAVCAAGGIPVSDGAGDLVGPQFILPGGGDDFDVPNAQRVGRLADHRAGAGDFAQFAAVSSGAESWAEYVHVTFHFVTDGLVLAEGSGAAWMGCAVDGDGLWVAVLQAAIGGGGGDCAGGASGVEGGGGS